MTPACREEDPRSVPWAGLGRRLQLQRRILPLPTCSDSFGGIFGALRFRDSDGKFQRGSELEMRGRAWSSLSTEAAGQGVSGLRLGTGGGQGLSRGPCMGRA